MITKKDFIARIYNINEWGPICIVGNGNQYVINQCPKSSGWKYSLTTTPQPSADTIFYGERYSQEDLLVAYEEENFYNCQWAIIDERKEYNEK